MGIWGFANLMGRAIGSIMGGGPVRAVTNHIYC